MPGLWGSSNPGFHLAFFRGYGKLCITVHFPAQSVDVFTPHPNLSDEVNRHIVQSEIEGGVFLEEMPPSTVLQIYTQHRCYTAVLLGGSQALISGHPEFCPSPVPVAIAGSTWGGSMLKMHFVGRGMHLEFHHPEYRTPIVTSPVRDIRECPEPTPPPISVDA